MAEEGGKGSDGGGDEEVVDQQPGRQSAYGKLHPRAEKVFLGAVVIWVLFATLWILTM